MECLMTRNLHSNWGPRTYIHEKRTSKISEDPTTWVTLSAIELQRSERLYQLGRVRKAFMEEVDWTGT